MSDQAAVNDPRRFHRRFHVAMAWIIALTAFVGFARTYYLSGWTDSPALSPLLHIHGLIGTIWIALYVGQTVLVGSGQVHLHRRLGVFGGVLAASLVAVGWLTGVTAAAARGGGADAIALFSFPVIASMVFALLVLLGVRFRQRPEVHKRFMLLANISVVIPAIARLPFIEDRPAPIFLFLATLLAAGAFHDRRTRGRVHPVTLWGGLFVLASAPLRAFVGTTGAWQVLAGWLLSLPWPLGFGN